MKFTLEELQQLLNMLDLATKTGGLQVAPVAIRLAQKIQQMGEELQQSMSVEDK